MHHPVLIGFVLAFLATRLASRIVFRRRMAWAHGGCGRASRLDRPGGRWRWEAAPPPTARSTPAVDVTAALELSARQRELYDDVIGRVGKTLRGAAIADVLRAVAAEPFDRATVEGNLADRELVDDVEQLHDSLTPEQRARLRALGGA